VLATAKAAERLPHGKHRVELVTSEELSKKCGPEAVHQGVALHVNALDDTHLDEVMHQPRLAILDQVTDPHNVGAILRSAAAFGIGALIVPKDHAPQETGVMAKAACGGLEMVPLVRVTNLAKAMKELKEQSYWLLGMDGAAKAPVRAAKDYDKCVIVLGAEGTGMRRLTAENCDLLVKIPMSGAMESLNVSNAAAIAFYEAFSG
jgi:23S rRNA (guanosine2251-2'-O)-methyltransferase